MSPLLRLGRLVRAQRGAQPRTRLREGRVKELLRQGELPRALVQATQLHESEQTMASRRLLEHVRGLYRAVDPRWLPRLAGPPENLPGSPSNCIAHLFKVSYPFESTGGSIRNLNTVTSQREVGLAPYVVTPVHYPRNQGVDEFPLEHEVNGVPHLHFDLGRGSHSLSRLIQYDTLMTAAVLRSRGAALIHAASGYHGYDLALKGLALGRHFDVPVIYEVRSFHEHTWTGDWVYGERSVYTELRKVQENRCMADADWVVTISETMRESLIGRGVDPAKLTVIPNAIDPAKFATTESPRDVRSRFARPGQVIVGYISNMSRREGHDCLIRAVAELRREGRETVCLLVGDGREREALEKLSRDLGIAQYVHFTGNVDHAEINDYYAAIDVFVVPRRRDLAADLVTPLKPFEAMAMGKALVVSDRPALYEIVGNEDRGLVFRTEDFRDLARKLQGLIDNPDYREHLASRGRSWVMTERTWTANARRYQELYAEVQARHTRAEVTRHAGGA